MSVSFSIDEMRSFFVLAGELHFRKASERLFMSQPALSKQIRKLEEKVGGALFTRTRRRVLLTEAGNVLLPLAKRLVQDSEAALGRAREAAEGRAGTLRIGFGIASAAEILPRTLLRFRRSNPHVELQMRDMSTPGQTAALLDGRIDVGILRMPIVETEFESFPLSRERLVAVAPESVAYSRKQGLASLRDQPFICFPKSASATLYQHVQTVCRRAGFSPNLVQEANELFTILNLVRAGLGVSLVPSAAIRMNVRGVRFYELHMAEAEWQTGLAWKRLSEKRPLILRFAEAMRAAVREPGAGGASRNK
ncbi:MAG TPA: LysR family transcriptional regulator [Terriglobales bacterium]|nr:LysR family transcriptional regulator [Terriglobales bacterium]